MDNEALIHGHFNKLNSELMETQYEELYQADADFRALADRTEIELIGIRDAGRKSLKNQFATWDEELKTNQNPSKGKNHPFYAVAASVLITIGLGLFFLQKGSSPAFEDYYEVYENYEFTSTRESSATPSGKVLAYRAYDAKEYANSLKYFNEYLSVETEDYPAIFFRGICYLETKNYQAASLDFNQVYLHSKDYQSAAYWYDALAQLAMKNYDKAKTSLGNILTDKEFGAKAKKLLKALTD